MKFRTEIKIQPIPYPVDYHSKIFGLGSCFVDNIKTKLEDFRFQVKINDFGTVFNLYSINNVLDRIVNKKYFSKKDLFFHEDVWKSFEVHSSFNNKNEKDFLLNINKKIDENHSFLKQADWVFFTLGTAWIYRYIKTGEIVNNCHKLPQKNFTKVLLSIDFMMNTANEITRLLQKINPDIKMLITLSPVRHLKDGFIENQRSKARLTEVVHQWVNNENSFYFPSYEILMDDLRDYRFYKKDLVHPNEMAIEYIWEKFSDAMISGTIKEDMKKIESISKFFSHHPFNGEHTIPPKIQQNINIIKEKYPLLKLI